jgi:hypothetical protein
MVAILSTLAQRFRFTPIGVEPVVSVRIGTYSLNGLWAGVERLSRRAKAHLTQGRSVR